jgi:hypothetical protein
VGAGAGVGVGVGVGVGAAPPPLPGVGVEPDPPVEPGVVVEPLPSPFFLWPLLGVVEVVGVLSGTDGVVGVKVSGAWSSPPPLDATAITTIRKNSAIPPSAT